MCPVGATTVKYNGPFALRKIFLGQENFFCLKVISYAKENFPEWKPALMELKNMLTSPVN